MALRVPAAMALCLLLSLMAVAHCVVPLEQAADDLATNASLSAVTDGEGLLRLPSREDSAVPDEVDDAEREVPVEQEPVEPVAEPDPDRSNPDSDGEEDLMAAEKLSDEKAKEQIEDEDEEEKKLKKNRDGDNMEDKEEKKKKRKKQHGGDGKGKKKEKKTKKHHESNDTEEEEEEEEMKKKQVHRVEKEKTTKKRPCHHKNRSNNGDDSDDEDDEHEKKAKRWRKKAVSRSMFGHGRRSQREEDAKEEVNN